MESIQCSWGCGLQLCGCGSVCSGVVVRSTVVCGTVSSGAVVHDTLIHGDLAQGVSFSQYSSSLATDILPYPGGGDVVAIKYLTQTGGGTTHRRTRLQPVRDAGGTLQQPGPSQR